MLKVTENEWINLSWTGEEQQCFHKETMMRSTINLVIRSKSHFIILIVIFLFLFAPAWSTKAQPPTPSSPRNELIQEIQSQAQRDAEQNTRQSTSDLDILFGEEARQVGLTMREVVAIYDEAYQTALNAKPLWKKLEPKAGWLVAAVLFFFFILKTVAQDNLTRFFNWLGEHLYLWLAQHRLFWRLALRHYRQALVQAYQELKVPFRPDRPLDMSKIYVQLRVIGGHSDEPIEAYQAMAEHKRLVISGAPGAGKTMLLKHLTLTYAEKGLAAIPGSPIPVYLELHRLNENDDLFTQLVEVLKRNHFPKPANFLQANLDRGSLLFLFDGLDEVNRERRDAVVEQIKDLLSEHRGCRAIVTCRTAVYRGEFDDWNDRRMEIVEFDDQQTRRFLETWEVDMPEGKSVNHLLRTLRERPRILKLARNPLLLTIIAYLYTDTPFVLPHSRSEFYKEAITTLLDRWKQSRNQYKAAHKRLVLRHLALFNQDRAAMGEQDRRTIALTEILAQIKEVLPSLELDDKHAQPMLDEIVERSGLLIRLDGGLRYQFTHLTLQEYFAAEALSGDMDGLVRRFGADPDLWRETVKLWCGLEHDSTHLLKEIYQLDPLVAFEALGDTRQVKPNFANQVIADFKARLLAGDAEEGVLEAFAIVAADPRPRGQGVFHFLKETLTDEAQEARVRLAAGKALSLSNLPAAAKLLAENAVRFPDLRPMLVQMGNLAVEPLAHLAGEGHDWALEGLRTIGTPEAAQALIPFLWQNQGDLRYRAAWALAGLLDKPGVEERLRTSDLTSAWHQALRLDWVWEPFVEKKDSPLSVIAGRIAYLLANTPPELLPDPVFPLDPRLVVPLCTIEKLPHTLENLEEGRQITDKLKSLLTSMLDREGEANNTEAEAREQFISEALAAIQPEPTWRALLAGIPSALQYTLLRRLLRGQRQPKREDWRTIFRPVAYQFESSWHSYGLRILIAALCLLGLWEIGSEILALHHLMSWDGAKLAMMGLASLGLLWLSVRSRWDLEAVEIGGVILLLLSGLMAVIALDAAGISVTWLSAAVVGAVWGGVVGTVLSMVHVGYLAGAVWGGVAGAVWGGVVGVAVDAVGFPPAFSPAGDFDFAYVFVVVGIIVLASLRDAFGVNTAYVFVDVVAVAAAVAVVVAAAVAVVGTISSAIVVAINVAVVVAVIVAVVGTIYLADKGDLVRTVIVAGVGAGVVAGVGVLVYTVTVRVSTGWGRTAAAIFWAIWFAAAAFLWWRGDRLTWRSQNPLHGLLEQENLQAVARPRHGILPFWRLNRR